MGEVEGEVAGEPTRWVTDTSAGHSRWYVERFRSLAAAGFTLEHRFATWDLRPWQESADFAVSVLRRPA